MCYSFRAFNHKVKGFTLLELITVMVIIGVLSVVAVTRIQGKQGFAESGWQKRVISALRSVQQRAMQDTRSGICQQLLIDAANNQFGLPAIASPCSTTIDFSHSPFLSSSAEGLNNDDLTISAVDIGVGAIAVIGFNGLGQPVNVSDNRICSNSCAVTLTGSESATVVIEYEGYVHGQ